MKYEFKIRVETDDRALIEFMEGAGGPALFHMLLDQYIANLHTLNEQIMIEKG